MIVREYNKKNFVGCMFLCVLSACQVSTLFCMEQLTVPAENNGASSAQGGAGNTGAARAAATPFIASLQTLCIKKVSEFPGMVAAFERVVAFNRQAKWAAYRSLEHAFAQAIDEQNMPFIEDCLARNSRGAHAVLSQQSLDYALVRAVGRDWRQLAATLLDQGAELQPANVNNSNLVFNALRANHIGMAQFLIDAVRKKHGQIGVKAMVNVACHNQYDGHPQVPLVVAAAAGTAGINFLLDNGAEINKQDEDGRTAILHMCKTGGQPFAQPEFRNLGLLLERGADPNIQDKWKMAPLHWLSFMWGPDSDGDNSYKAMELLVQYGADPELPNIEDKTPLAKAKEACARYNSWHADQEPWVSPAVVLLTQAAERLRTQRAVVAGQEAATRAGAADMDVS